MFEKKDFKALDRQYFNVIQTTAYHIILESNNTHHIWDIYCRDYKDYRSLIISHKHTEEDPFHIQPGMHPRTVAAAQEMIKKHDEYYLSSPHRRRK